MSYKNIFKINTVAILLVSFLFQNAFAITISTPFSSGQRWVAGGYHNRMPGGCNGGSYYGEDFHVNKDHYAIDFNGVVNSDCTRIKDDLGEPVLSIADGKVLSNSDVAVKGYGYHIRVDHGQGYVSLYAHLNSKPNLAIGQNVKRGQQIGNVGKTGGDWGPHLHFVLYKDGQSIPPSPMDGHTLLANESGKMILSKNQIGTTPPPTNTTFKAPALITPKSKQTLDKAPLVDFSWQDASYGSENNLQYRLHIFFPDQSSAVYSSAWNKNWTSFQKGFSSWNGTNHLRFAVQVKNSQNQILQSEVRHFYLNFTPGKPKNLAPTNNTSTATTLTLSWQDGGDQDNYPNPTRNFKVLMYKDGALFRTSVWRPDTKWVIAVDKGTYQWEVCADDGQTQACSSKLTFKAK